MLPFIYCAGTLRAPTNEVDKTHRRRLTFSDEAAVSILQAGVNMAIG
jgi:hypothetical protein